MKRARQSLYWKWIKRAAEILGALCIFVGISNFLNYMYVPTDNSITRIMWHHFYEDKGKIDNIYLGPSLVFAGVNPMLLDDMNGQYNFDMASGNQPLNGSYYLLKEADKYNSLSHVYLNLFYRCTTKNSASEDPIDSAYSSNWVNTDFMKNSFNRYKYMASISDLDKCIDTIFPYCRYREKLNDWDYITQMIENKNKDSYSAYEFHGEYSDGNGYVEFQQQGYQYSTRVFFDHKRLWKQNNILNEHPIGEKSEEYLRKIIKYCQEQDIAITLFATPIDDLVLISTDNYDNFVNQIREIAKEYGIEFYDFNLTKEKYLPIHYEAYYHDAVHLNSKGAEMFTVLFHEIVSGNAAENGKYFYTSYAEKLQKEPPAIYGLIYKDPEDVDDSSEQTRVYWIASNRESEMEYKIVLTPDEGGGRIIQDFTNNKQYVLPANEHGSCTIFARMKETPEEVQTLKVRY